MLPTDTAPPSRPTVFVSYSHRDEGWKDRVVRHLRVLAPEGGFALWDDRQITAGDDWRPEIEQALARAAVAVLLISVDFLTSDFILNQEVPRLLARRQTEGLRVIPLIVRPCAWKSVSWLSAIQSRPRDGAALASMGPAKADEALAAFAVEVRDLLAKAKAEDAALTVSGPLSFDVPDDSPKRSAIDKGLAPSAPPMPTRDAPQEQDDAEYQVWYGTNRRPNDPADPGRGFSGERDTAVHYGTCRVFVPKSHKIGSTGSRWWQRLLNWTDDRLQLMEIRGLATDAYWRSMQEHLTTVDLDERDAVIFVHGFNVSFEEAALRAAQIGFDLSVQGATAFFSWPSRGSVFAYSEDEATIGASERAIADFMVDVATQSGARAVHVVAHSMGNRGVLGAVTRIAADAQHRTGVPFGQFILAAADVDADTFRQECAAYGTLARRTTLYVSARDRAVEASKWLHGFPRAGLVPPVLVAPGIDTINVTGVDLTLLGHGYVAEARDVLNDMHDLLRRGSPPRERFGVRPAQSGAGDRYWLIGK